MRNLLARMVRGHAPSIIVERRERTYAEERGWVRNGNEYRGNYQTPSAVFQGYALEQTPGNFQFFLYGPSEQIRADGHWTCFQPNNSPGWYFVHMSRQPKDLSSGIITIERLISRAYGS